MIKFQNGTKGDSSPGLSGLRVRHSSASTGLRVGEEMDKVTRSRKIISHIPMTLHDRKSQGKE